MRDQSENENEGELSDLTVKDLKDVLNTCGLPVSRNNSALVSPLVPFLEKFFNGDVISEDGFDVDAKDQHD